MTVYGDKVPPAIVGKAVYVMTTMEPGSVIEGLEPCVPESPPCERPGVADSSTVMVKTLGGPVETEAVSWSGGTVTVTTVGCPTPEVDGPTCPDEGVKNDVAKGRVTVNTLS